MARFCALASSSAGNSTYLSSGGGALLIDAGISCRRIVTALASIEADVSELAGILLTHEHTDHIKGLRVLTGKHPIPIYATAPVLTYLSENDAVAPKTPLVEVTAAPFEAAGMQITAFATPHDSVASVGYRITTSDGHRVAIATDLGHVTREVEAGVSGCELVLLESNYEPQLLRMGPYPPFLKRRIASDHGHLDNGSSAEFAARLVQSGTTRFFLGHLSRENNNPALAEQTVRHALTACGAQEGSDFLLAVAPYDTPGKLVRF